MRLPLYTTTCFFCYLSVSVDLLLHVLCFLTLFLSFYHFYSFLSCFFFTEHQSFVTGHDLVSIWFSLTLFLRQLSRNIHILAASFLSNFFLSLSSFHFILFSLPLIFSSPPLFCIDRHSVLPFHTCVSLSADGMLYLVCFLEIIIDKETEQARLGTMVCQPPLGIWWRASAHIGYENATSTWKGWQRRQGFASVHIYLLLFFIFFSG